MNSVNLTPEIIFSDPDYLLSDIDYEQGLAIFFKASADEIRRSSFLDQRIRTADKTFYQVALADFIAIPTALQPDFCKCYIFHTSHVGSTLVAKLLGLTKGVGVLREPFILRKLSIFYNELDRPEARMSPENFNRIFVHALSFLSRRRPTEDRLLIKCTSYTNNLAASLFQHVPQAHGIAMYLPLRPFITTIFNSEAGLRDIKQQAPVRLQRLHRLLGETTFTLHQLQPGEQVAMSWATEMLTLHQLKASTGNRLKFINFDVFLQDIAAGVRDMAAHLQLDFTEQQIAAVVTSTEISTYSKGEHEYNAEIRARQLNITYKNNATLINDGLDWMNNAASRFTLLRPLLELYSVQGAQVPFLLYLP
jgi:hypothetical protein